MKYDQNDEILCMRTEKKEDEMGKAFGTVALSDMASRQSTSQT